MYNILQCLIKVLNLIDDDPLVLKHVAVKCFVNSLYLLITDIDIIDVFRDSNYTVLNDKMIQQ
jgi:hypothetical protein